MNCEQCLSKFFIWNNIIFSFVLRKYPFDFRAAMWNKDCSSPFSICVYVHPLQPVCHALIAPSQPSTSLSHCYFLICISYFPLCISYFHICIFYFLVVFVIFLFVFVNQRHLSPFSIFLFAFLLFLCVVVFSLVVFAIFVFLFVNQEHIFFPL